MSRRRVLLVNLSFGLAGTERRFANIWRELRRRGNVEPILLIPDVLAESLEAAGLIARGEAGVIRVSEPSVIRRALSSKIVRAIPVLGTPASVIRSRAIASAFHEVIRRECAIPDTVIHVGLNCSALRFPAGPIVYECMDSLLTQLGTRHYERAAMRPAVMHCQTRRIRDALLTSSRVSRPKWSTVVSESYFASYPSDIDYDANVKDSSSIAFVGRLSEEKQPQILVDAVTQLHRRGISCRLTMLGRGPLEDSLRMLIRDRGLEEQIAIGFDARPTTALLNSSIFVTLQKGDNYGSQALLEAMGCGCAIIATEVGETRRIVSSELGLFVPPDGSGLVDALAELILNPALTRSLGERARRTALMEFSADSYVGFLEKLYEKADALAQTR